MKKDYVKIIHLRTKMTAFPWRTTEKRCVWVEEGSHEAAATSSSVGAPSPPNLCVSLFGGPRAYILIVPLPATSPLAASSRPALPPVPRARAGRLVYTAAWPL